MNHSFVAPFLVAGAAAALAHCASPGSRYQGPGLDFWEHQGEAAVTWSGASFTCTPMK